MIIKCYICEKEIKPGEGCNCEGKSLHKKCEDKYYEWLGMMYKESMK